MYCRRGERFTDQCVYESGRFGGGSVMVCAGICHGGRTQFKIVQGTLHAVKYRDGILDPIVPPFLQQLNFDHRQSPPEALQVLRDALVHEWKNILQAFIQRWVGSMCRRCEAVVAARDGHMRY